MKLRVLLCVLLAGVLVAADEPTDDEGKGDKDKVNGTWALESGSRGGESQPEEYVKAFRLALNDGKFHVKLADGELEGTYKIDASKDPKEITFTGEGEGARNGIYSIDGDKMKMIVSEPGESRPTKLHPKEGSGIYMVLKRESK